MNDPGYPSFTFFKMSDNAKKIDWFNFKRSKM